MLPYISEIGSDSKLPRCIVFQRIFFSYLIFDGDLKKTSEIHLVND